MEESQETIKRVAEEGREARNLVNWIADGSPDVVKITGKPPTSPRSHSVSPRPAIADVRKDMDSRILLKSKRRGALSRPKSRLRSASAGRIPEKDLRARYWTFLFKNLHRAVDEIYQTCEMDESIVESKEAIMMLESYSKDFHALIQYININKDYEKTAPINRPTSLAWEVRKSSPGKSLLKNVFIEKLTASSSQAKRILCFDSISDSKNVSAQAVSLKSEIKSPTINSIEEISSKEENTANIESNSQNLLENSCDITISVVQEVNEVFPCNDDLIVNEICCLSDKVVHDKPSVIVEAESESINQDSEDVSLVSSTDDSKNEAVFASAEDEKSESVVLAEYSDINIDTSENSSTAVVKNINKENELIVASPNEIIDNNLNCQLKKENENLSNKLISDQESNLIEADKKKTTLKRKVLIKKSSKVNEKVSTALTSSKQNSSSEEKSNLKNNVKTMNSSVKNPEKDKIALKISTKECDIIAKKDTDSNTLTKNVSTVTLAKKVAATSLVEKSTNTSFSATKECEINTTKRDTDDSTLTKNIGTVILAKKVAAKSLVEKSTNTSFASTKECEINATKKDTDGNALIKNAGTVTLAKRVAAKSLVEKSTNTSFASTKECEINTTKKDTDDNALIKNAGTVTLAKRVAAKSLVEKSTNTSFASTKECEINTTKKDTDDNSLIKNAGTVTLDKRVAAKPLVEKSTNTSFAKSVSSKPVSAVRKITPKMDNSADGQKEGKAPVKTFAKTSAIQRNISYVSSLSSKNQLEKAANGEKKKPTRTISHAMKLPQKSGSMSSLHKISIRHRWSDKASSVEQIPEIIKSNTDEDSDGWETVRGRNRCRNSPAKKIPFSTEKNDKALDMAKLNQSRFGGFPYTTKNNTKVSTNKATPTKGEKNANKEKQPKNENNSTKSKSLDVASTEGDSGSKQLHNLHKNSLEDCESSLKPECFAEKSLSKTEAKSDNDIFYLKLLTELQISEEISLKISSNIFKSNHLKKSASVPCLFTEFCKNTCFSKSKSLSEQSLSVKKYKVKHFSRNSIEKNMSSSRKKNRKVSKSQDFEAADNALNTSLDESDTGLTSDDQDGQTSHDEAYDAECQELYDAAWKYKILEQQVHKLELSWGEQMDRFDMELRTPGRALEMHEKLSSPFRKKSLMESIRLQEEKQVKAREQRERLLEEKIQKIKEIEKKRQEMKSLVEQRQEKQRILMSQKLQRAEEKRKRQLEMIIRKAHDEEEKVNEIAFINTLEAQNKRHDLISKEKDHEARLHDIQEERQRKLEEKAAKEAAAEERRKLLEAERQARLNEMQEKRKIRDHKVEQLFLVKEKERQELASQKARDRELRLSALNAQQQITIEELQKKIQLKQEESARRHEENMEQIRQKAFELSVRRCSSNNDDAPQPVPYETKKICTLCNVLIGSEVYLLSHLRGKKHQETVKDQYQGKDPSAEELELYNLKHIVDASTDQLDPNIAFDKERQKALKKRCKKLRQRMSNRGQDYESQLEKSTDTINLNVKSKMTKVIPDIKKLITTYEKSSNDNNLLTSLERSLKEFDNVLEKKLNQDKVAFRMVGGLGAVIDIFKLVSSLPMEKSAFLHKKIINHLSNTAESMVEKCHENCMYILFSNKIGCLLDLLIQRLNGLIPNNYNQMIINNFKSPGPNIQVDITGGKLMHFLSNILSVLSVKSNQLRQNGVENPSQKENYFNEFQVRVQDVISYIVSIGIVDKLSQYFNSIQGPIGNEEEVVGYLLDCVAFLTSIIKLYSDCFTSASNSKTDDMTQLIATFKVTNMIGTVSLLYGLLLHSGVSSRGETPPPQLPKQIELLTFSTLCMLNHIAVMNLQAFQTILGSEGLSLQLRHITSHLLGYCSHWTSDKLLHEVILLVGYFTVLNVDNQSLIQAGQRPTVLQQLCSLPFLYFSDSELTDILFPTLIACCVNNPSNKTILEQEMSSELLSNYIEVKYLNSDENSKQSKNGVPEKKWFFSTRFPKNCWSSAKHYFAVK